MKHRERLFLLAFNLVVVPLQAQVTFHGPIIQWHRNPTNFATFSWVERTEGGSSTGKWSEGKSGFGYGDDDDATELPGMRGNFTRVYIAKRFILTEKPTSSEAKLTLEINYDDAFIAFINGREVARSANVNGQHATAKVTGSHENKKTEIFDIANPHNLLKAGPNLISIEGHNVSKSSSDFSLEPRLRLGDNLIVRSGDSWRYLAGKDATEKWYLTYPELTPETNTPPEWNLFVTVRNQYDPPELPTMTSHPFGDTNHKVHFARFDNLSPATEYNFTLSANKKEVKTGWFRTAPNKLEKPISFVVGGDMGTTAAEPICKLAGKEDVLFAYLGGDLAYANGREVPKWYAWLDNWANLAVTENNRHLPIVAAIGNHEIKKGMKPGQAPGEEMSPFYMTLFDLPNDGKTNFSVDFGDYMSLIILDSNHIQKVSDQTTWLANQLRIKDEVGHVFPIYHRPAWGTGVKGNMKEIQQLWCPLFEKHQVACVFENDHHTYKRSWKLTNGKRDDAKGILYIGDGAWGATTRPITDNKLDSVGARQYLAKWAKENHLVRATIYPDGTRKYEAKIANGSVIDQFTDTP